MYPDANKAKKLFDQSKTIALFGHIHADGDCIGSLLGLGKLLEKQGKKISYFAPTEPSALFSFLPKTKKIKTIFDYKKYDMLVFVDFTGYDRIKTFTEKNPTYFDQHPLVIIDHHPERATKHALLIKDTTAMSCAEIIVEQAEIRRKKYLDAEIATYLYLGISTDSGNFMYDNDHKRIFNNALKLVVLWADKKLIVDNIFRKKSIEQMKFIWLLLERIRIQGDVLYSYYTENDIKRYHLDSEEAGYGLTVIQNIDGPKVVVLFKQIGNTCRWSLRSKWYAKNKKGIDCNDIAKQMNGWWHRNAAWFEVQAKTNSTKQMVDIVAFINKNIQQQK